ncbi:MAG: LytTR family transcriptional regulator [Lachnospiraceae bacterium]|nr:LytTR family transcriptional regulator [Lachnospiraceae bacterium]
MSVVIFDNAVILNTKKMKYYLRQEQIIYVKSAGKKIIIRTEDDIITIYGTMKELEAKLDENFYRCHRKYLINMKYVNACDGKNIYLDGDYVVQIAREKQKEFAGLFQSS